ncbi:MAG: argininosuccinate lyase [Deltaproteobacteria bacterium]|nr:argininosuccinate lyase [Deltaproteobacteria bacterium]
MSKSQGSPLWDRGTPLDQVVATFTVGRDPELDGALAAYDALGSAAHASMLRQIGILSQEDHEALTTELRAIAEQARAGAFEVAPADEDCHTAIENRLTQKLGDAGRRIHTGRSRNDQVIAMLRLFGREALAAQFRATVELAEQLFSLAETHRDVAVAGYTHTRQAMPSTFGLFFGAHAELQVDNLSWLRTAFDHLDRCPLGSASGYGVALGLDRQLVSDLLRFSRVQLNTLAVQNDRGKSESLALCAVATVVSDLGRLASDLIWFSTEELGYVALDESITTGSSIMPQKRNPDVLELIRATAAQLRSRQAEAAQLYGGLLSGYHRDMQWTKAPFVEGLRDGLRATQAMQRALCNLTIDAEACRRAMKRAIGATDALYQRVQAGQPFRAAYKAIAAAPDSAVTGDPAEAWRARDHLGAPANLQLDAGRQRLADQRCWLEDTEKRLNSAWDLLFAD